MEGSPESAGTTYTFSVTFRNGKKDIIKAKSGTALCDQLLHKAFDGESGEAVVQPKKPKELTKAPELQKNQLPPGIYEVGKDIPAGVFDFHHVWGNGCIQVYSAKEIIFGNSEYFEYVGDSNDYEMLECLHVTCKEGWYVYVTNNLVVSISRSN